MENKQTVVEWLVEQLKPAITLQEKYINEFLEQAKAMHKQQIIDAYEFGVGDAYNYTSEEGELFYNETYEK